MRLTVGHDNTMEQIDYVLDTLPGIVSRLRSLSPAWRERACGMSDEIPSNAAWAGR